MKRMSEIFKGKLGAISGREIVVEGKDESVGYIDLDKDRQAIVHAVNSHDKLVEFTKWIIRCHLWDYTEPDGLDIQEKAEKLGLIKSREATKDDIHEESDYEEGDIIYEFTDTLKEIGENDD